MNTAYKISKQIQKTLSSQGDPKKAQWLENYVKHDIKSKGVGIPLIRSIIKEYEKEYSLTKRPIKEQRALLNDLMSQTFTEDKIAAILYMQLYWKEEFNQQKIDCCSQWFDKGYISDWNVCDWLCVRILTPLIDIWSRNTVSSLKQWNKNTYLWKARASLVPFAQCKTIAQYKDVIEELSTTLIKREERFCKTAVGWVLRECSKHDTQFVKNFIAHHTAWITPEVHKNATKYFKQ